MSKKKIAAAAAEVPPRISIKTPWNAIPDKGRLITDPSLTVPNQSMSVQEIMRRNAQGLPLHGARIPIYDGEDAYVPDHRTLDLVDLHEMAEANAQNIDDLKRKAMQEQEEKRQKPVKPSKITKPGFDPEDAEIVEPKNGGGSNQNSSDEDPK